MWPNICLTTRWFFVIPSSDRNTSESWDRDKCQEQTVRMSLGNEIYQIICWWMERESAIDIDWNGQQCRIANRDCSKLSTIYCEYLHATCKTHQHHSHLKSHREMQLNTSTVRMTPKNIFNYKSNTFTKCI